MQSRWHELKDDAITFRQEGMSIKKIEQKLGIPRSTLSGWLKNIILTESQIALLQEDRKVGLIKAQEKAATWHQAEKQVRIKAEASVTQLMIDSIDLDDKVSVELALAFLYLGEGSKKNSSTSLGSSDVRIARFFVESVKQLYGIQTEKIKCHLHLRADQNEQELKNYWGTALSLPESNFGKSSFDARTLGRPTYPEYKGVCLISCGRVEIQRRLMYIAHGFCDRMINATAMLGGG
jgi:transcriptional regulator with XRE-family HTH domain